MNLPPLPEGRVLTGSNSLWVESEPSRTAFTAEQVRSFGELCARMAREEERERWKQEPTPEMIAEGWRAATATVEWTHESVRYLWQRMVRAAAIRSGK